MCKRMDKETEREGGERKGTVPPAGPYRSAKPLEEKPCFIYSAAYPWKPERSLQARPVFHPCSGE